MRIIPIILTAIIFGGWAPDSTVAPYQGISIIRPISSPSRPDLGPVWCGPEPHLHQPICPLREIYGYVLTEEAMLVQAAADLNSPLAHYLMRRAAAIMREEIRRVADPHIAPDLVP